MTNRKPLPQRCHNCGGLVYHLNAAGLCFECEMLLTGGDE